LKPIYNGIHPDGHPRRSTAYTGFHPDGDFMESLEKWRLTHVNPSEPAYNGTYHDGLPSRSMGYTGLHPNGDPSENLLKDGGSPTLIPRSQPIIGYIMMAA